MTNEAIRPAVPFTSDSLARAVDEAARQLVNREVCYCVSALVSALRDGMYEYAGSPLNEDDAATLSYRAPDADDFKAVADDLDDIGIVRVADGWYVIASENEGGGFLYTEEVAAWRAAFDLAGEGYPDGSEVYEHWLVTDWFAEKLEAQGESVVRDVAGLTIWGRSTSGQAIYADSVVREIARDLHDLPRAAA